MIRHTGRMGAMVAAAMLAAGALNMPARAETDPKAVLTTYADIALAGYRDRSPRPRR